MFEFSKLLDSNPEESVIQTWLQNHPVAFGNRCGVVAKLPLGSEYEVDFMLVQNISVGFTWTLIELKRPGVPILRKDGLLSADANSAIRQIERYQSWIAENISFARRFYQEIYKPAGKVIIGRRSSISEDQKALLRHINSQRDVEIMTYDRLLDNLRYISFLQSNAHDVFTQELCQHLEGLKNKFCFNAK
jgi:hypothetical protein